MCRAKSTVLALILISVCAAPAVARADSPYPPGPFAPWDGANPFNCEHGVQDAGTGSTVPFPGDDPFCVEFDKTQQNIFDLGMFEFLANEPARVAGAGDKCFYYQTDHWTASLVQGEMPEFWHWDGQYFFDKAFGVGGVNVNNFRILGQPASPSDYGEVPPEYAPYFDDSGGGAYAIADIPADPTCAAKVDTPAEQASVYSAGAPPLPDPVSAPGPSSPQSQAQGASVPGKKARCPRKKRKGHRGKRSSLRKCGLRAH
jgi:hypothetical protein